MGVGLDTSPPHSGEPNPTCLSSGAQTAPPDPSPIPPAGSAPSPRRACPAPGHGAAAAPRPRGASGSRRGTRPRSPPCWPRTASAASPLQSAEGGDISTLLPPQERTRRLSQDQGITPGQPWAEPETLQDLGVSLPSPILQHPHEHPWMQLDAEHQRWIPCPLIPIPQAGEAPRAEGRTKIPKAGGGRAAGHGLQDTQPTASRRESSPVTPGGGTAVLSPRAGVALTSRALSVRFSSGPRLRSLSRMTVSAPLV